MGSCLSCLRAGHSEHEEEDDESRFLFDDPHNLHYGSFGDQQLNGQDDALEAQREVDALQGVVARTSDNMVDIYEIAPTDLDSHAAHSPNADVSYQARMLRCQNLLSKLSLGQDSGTVGTFDWTYHHNDPSDRGISLAKVEPQMSEPLVGNFADAANAMR